MAVSDWQWPNWTAGPEEDDQARITHYERWFQQHRTRRVNFEAQWEEAASLCWPEYRNTFAYLHDNAPGIKRTQYQIDSSAAIASHRFGIIVDAFMSPSHLMWSKVSASNKDVLKDRAARLWFDEVTRVLWAERYQATANFIGQNQQNCQGLGVFGYMGMITDELDSTLNGGTRGLSYRSCPVGEIYPIQDHQGLVRGFFRHFRRTAAQAYQCWGDEITAVLKAALNLNSQVLYNFLQVCHHRTDWTPWEILSPRGKQYVSVYMSVEGRCILEEGGYRTLPLAYGRYMQAPEEDYGRGPAQMVLPALETLNAEKGTFLKQGHLAGDPAYLIGDDGLVDFKTHAGAFNYGGMTADGRPLVSILPTGNIQITKEMMDEERGLVADAFLVTLFRELLEDAKGGNQKSAREVIERANERGIFLEPSIGRQNTEYLGRIIDRELDLLSWLRKLPPMPPVLREAEGDYQIIYTSPLARAMRGQEVAGAMQTVEWAEGVVNATGEPGLMDIFDFDTMLPEVAEIRGVPERWMASAQMRRQKARARAQQQARDQRAKELPGQAAIMKAQAITAKAQAGQNIGGTLSGTPQGGMPAMPGGPGQPGRPGFGGAPGQPGVPGQPGGY